MDRQIITTTVQVMKIRLEEKEKDIDLPKSASTLETCHGGRQTRTLSMRSRLLELLMSQTSSSLKTEQMVSQKDSVLQT